MGGPIRLWTRSDWRRRWGALAALTLLAGIAFGAAFTAVAGARRTASSFDRLRAATSAADHAVVIEDAFGGVHLDAASVRRVESLSQVAAFGRATTYIASLGDADWEFGLYSPEDRHLGASIVRDRVIRGRRPHPDRIDEVAINEASAASAKVDVGDVLTLLTPSPGQIAAIARGDEHAFDDGPLGPSLRMKVVGVFRGPHDAAGRIEENLFATPAFSAEYAGRIGYSSRLDFVQRAPGVTAREFDAALARINPGLVALDAAVDVAPARRTLDTLTVGLAVFALVAGLASVLAVGQAVSRHASAAASDQAALAAVGLTRRERRRALASTALPVAVLGALLAAAVTYAASGLMPVGLARQVDPDPGLRFDPIVALAAALAVAVVVACSAFLGSAFGMRTGLGRSTRRASTLATSLGSAGAPPVVTTGVRLALDRRPPALPVRSALFGVATAVVALVGALTFSASLDRLVGDPSRYGYGWDLTLDTSSLTVDEFTGELATDRNLDGVAVLSSSYTFARNDGIRAYGLEPKHGHVGYALRSGVQPVGADEVVVGPVTADQLGLEVGDTISVATCPCSDDPGAAKYSPVRVVGTALFPEDDDGNWNGGLGFSGSGYARHVGERENMVVAVRAIAGRAMADVASHLDRKYPGRVSAYSYPTRPGDIENLAGLRRFPRVLAGFAVLLGLAALAHVLVTTVRRRHAEIATLRSLGLTPGQTVRCIVWQASTMSGLALAIGIPAGLFLGAGVWLAATRNLGVDTGANRPLLVIVGVSAVAMTAAIAMSVPAGLRASRNKPARVLRAE